MRGLIILGSFTPRSPSRNFDIHKGTQLKTNECLSLVTTTKQIIKCTLVFLHLWHLIMPAMVL